MAKRGEPLYCVVCGAQIRWAPRMYCDACRAHACVSARYRRTARAGALTCVYITGSITESIFERRMNVKKRIGKRHLNKKIRRALEIIADVLGVVAFWALVYILIIVYG